MGYSFVYCETLWLLQAPVTNAPVVVSCVDICTARFLSVESGMQRTALNTYTQNTLTNTSGYFTKKVIAKPILVALSYIRTLSESLEIFHSKNGDLNCRRSVEK